MLSDVALKKAKQQPTAYKLYDTGGMFVLVAPTGGKLWRLKYRFAGKEKLLSLGAYPEVSLADARFKRDEARKQLHDGVDPGESRKAMKRARASSAANSFEAIAREWHTKFANTWEPSHADRVLRLLERDVFPWVGHRPIAEITAPELLARSNRFRDSQSIAWPTRR
jgi:Arm DNA-binding domain